MTKSGGTIFGTTTITAGVTIAVVLNCSITIAVPQKTMSKMVPLKLMCNTLSLALKYEILRRLITSLLTFLGYF